MTDEQNGKSFELTLESNSEADPEQEGQEKQTDAPKPVTLEDVDAHLEESFRRFQSRLEKQGNTLERRLQDTAASIQPQLDALQATGVTLSDEQQRAYGQRLMQDALVPPVVEEEQLPANVPQDVGTTEEEAKRISSNGQKIADYYSLKEGDPELVFVIANGTDQQFYDSLHKAGTAKQTRITQGSDNRQSEADNARGAVPATGGPPGGPQGMSHVSTPLGDLYEAAEKDRTKDTSRR